jgi:cell division transport system permease protein
MFAWLFAAEPDRRLLDGGRLRGATPWVIAIMSFSIVIVAAAGLALANTAGLVARSTEHRYAIQVPGGGGALHTVLRAVQAAPEVASSAAVPEREMRQTLARWLGPEAAASNNLPVPALINFDLRAGADVAAVERRVRAVSPRATLSSHGASLGPLLKSLRTLQWLALGLVLLLGTAAAAAVVLATRGALDTHSSTIQVMHGIGATDVQLTNLFQRKIAIDALLGSFAGGAAAALVLLVLATGASFAGELTGGAGLGPRDFVILLALPLALTILATWVARAAVLSALRRTL